MAQRARVRIPNEQAAARRDAERALHGEQFPGLAALAAAAIAADPRIPRDLDAPREAAAGYLRSPNGYRVWRQTMFSITLNSQTHFPADGGEDVAVHAGVTLGRMRRALEEAAAVMGRRFTRAMFVASNTYGSALDIVRVEATDQAHVELGDRNRFAHLHFAVIVTHYLHRAGPKSAGFFGPRVDVNVLKAIAGGGLAASLGEDVGQQFAQKLRVYATISDTPQGWRSYTRKDSPTYDPTLPAIEEGFEKVYPRDDWMFPSAFSRVVFNKKRRDAANEPIALDSNMH